MLVFRQGIVQPVVMFDSAVCEFPFVEGLPVREKSRIGKAWDIVSHMREAQAQHGLLIPERLAAKLAGVSSQRIGQLALGERLNRVYIDGHPFITEDSLVAWLKSERKTGRPCKAVATVGDCLKVAVEVGVQRKV